MSCCTHTSQSAFAFESPAMALNVMFDHIEPVETEAVDWQNAIGRILAQDIVSDRPSPSCDVSAMDGFALRLSDCQAGRLDVVGEVAIGEQPPNQEPGSAWKIVTGAPIPAGAQVVIKREDVHELDDAIEIGEPLVSRLKSGMNIRFKGENMMEGHILACEAMKVTAPMLGMMTGFGITRPVVRKQVRLGMITTGNEVVSPESNPTSWQLRDSNAPALMALCEPNHWLRLEKSVHAQDTPEAIAKVVSELIESCDALVFTGGVSMGDHDYVPGVVDSLGAKTIFHTLPQRPGKPVLGAVLNSKPIFGLPGNPLAVMICAHQMLIPALARRAGMTDTLRHPRMMRVVNADQKQLGLWWSRLAKIIDDDRVELVSSKGSGDVPSAALSDGYVVIPPRSDCEGRFPFYSWDC